MEEREGHRVVGDGRKRQCDRRRVRPGPVCAAAFSLGVMGTPQMALRSIVTCGVYASLTRAAADTEEAVTQGEPVLVTQPLWP